jgi:hypothetical protein
LRPIVSERCASVATIESIGSSTRIEGSKLTDREVERLACRTWKSKNSRAATSRKSPAMPK